MFGKQHKAQIYIHTQSDGLLPAAFCYSFLLLPFLSLNRGGACIASSCSLTSQSLARSQAIGHKQLLAITFALLARKQSIARTQSQAAARSQPNLSLSIKQLVISSCSQLLSHCSPASNQSHARNRRQLLAHNPISRPLTNNHNNQTISRNYFRRRKSERRGKFCFRREPAGTVANNELFAHLLRRLKRALCSKNSVKST